MAHKSKLPPRRKYGAESEASTLVAWLNAADPKHSSLRRVLTIRELLLMLELIAQKWRPFYRQKETSEKDAEKYAELEAASYTLADRMNQLLNRYRMTPTLEPRLGEGGAYINWRSPRARGFIAMLSDFPRVLPGVRRTRKNESLYRALQREVDEPEVIQRILNLSRTPYLSRVRQCDHCKRWFYATRTDQRFCKGRNCKQKHYQNGAGFKEHRRKYMKKYRRTVKEMSGIRSRQKRHSRQQRDKTLAENHSRRATF